MCVVFKSEREGERERSASFTLTESRKEGEPASPVAATQVIHPDNNNNYGYAHFVSWFSRMRAVIYVCACECDLKIKKNKNNSQKSIQNNNIENEATTIETTIRESKERVRAGATKCESRKQD